jgi:hypothetical protein
MTGYKLGIGMWAVAALAAGVACAETGTVSVSLLRSCGEPDVVAAISPRDAVNVHFSLGGYSEICYKVTATLEGKPVDGYVLGSQHPAVAEFEREARTHIPELPPPPAAVTAAKEADPNKPRDPLKDNAPAAPISFAGLRGTASNGKTVDLSQMRAPNVVLYFWSPMDRSSVKKAEPLDYIYAQYRQNGVEIVGVSSTRANLQHAVMENEVIWPQLVDSGQIAAQHHVESDKPYLILDGNRNVIAAVKSANELEPALRQAIKARNGGIR